MTLRAIYIALQVTPLLALVMVLPYTLRGFAKTKRLNVRRATYIYIFIIYALGAYFMTMLPLPSKDFFEVIPPLSECVQLVPFNCFFETNLLRSPVALAVIVFNLFLTLPLGFFMRFLFGARLGKTVIAGFFTSLLYELTQLSGLFFIYPAPYRLFDVDDLIINTLGALVGYFLTPLVARLLPSLDATDRQLMQGSESSFFQRGVAVGIDFAINLCATIALIIAIPPLARFMAESGSLLIFPVFYLIFGAIAAAYSAIFTGGTLGHRMVGLRLMTKGGRKASRLTTVIRTAAVFNAAMGISYWSFFFMTVNTEYAGALSVLWVFFGALLTVIASAIRLEMTYNAVTHGSSMIYDRICGTYAAYSSSKRRSMFGIRVIDVKELTPENIDGLSEKIVATLGSMGVSRESAIKVRLMAEGVMLDWMEQGLGGTPCELRLDRRFKAKALMLSVPGDNKTNDTLVGSYTEMLGKLDLQLTAYYAAEKNICNIAVP